MVVLSQFLHKTRIVGYLDCVRDFGLPFLGTDGDGWGLWRVGQIHYYYHFIIN